MVLNRISKVASTCETEAEKVVKRYEDVIDVIDELVQAAFATQMDSNAKKADAIHCKNIAQQKKDDLDQKRKNMKVLIEKYAKDEEKWTEDLAKRIDDMPSGWSAIGMGIVSGMAETAMGVVNSVRSV